MPGSDEMDFSFIPTHCGPTDLAAPFSSKKCRHERKN